MIKYPGAYLIADCRTPDCPFRNIQIYFFLGLGKFDIAYIQNNAMCGGCRQMVTSINDIAFYNCFWQYKGLTINSEHMESPPQRAGPEFVSFPHSNLSWKWLTIQALHLDRPAEPVESKSVHTQASSTTEESDQVVINTLTEEAERYRKKYKETKNKLNNLLDTLKANNKNI